MSRKAIPRDLDPHLIAAIAALGAATADNDERYPVEELDGTVYLPEIRSTTYAMNPAILCSALFGINKSVTREYIRRTFATTNGATIEYRGEELAQDDLSVLLGLLHQHRGMATSCELELTPSAFCTRIGWSDNGDSAARLQACLLRLRGAFLIVRSAPKADADAPKSKLARAIGDGWTLGFVSNFAWTGLTRWVVQIDSRIGQLFSTAPTYLLAANRMALTAGLQTWLYGYVEANTCAYAVPVETLHAACGSTAPLKEFSRQVRDALPKLAAIKAVQSHSTVKNGKVAIFKVASGKAKVAAAA